MLYVYLNFIQEDLTIYKKWAIPIIKTLNFIHAIIIWISSIVFCSIFIVGMIIEPKMNEIIYGIK